MLRNADEDIVLALAPEFWQTKAYVCFHSDEDLFFVLSYDLPNPNLWTPDPKHPHKYTQDGALEFSQYRDGVSDVDQVADPTWTKWDLGSYTDARTTDKIEPDSGHAGASIDNSEIIVDFSFTNALKMITDYQLKVRRATKRFVEAFAVRGASGQTTSTGHCAEY
jgi:hypothetical protein